MKGLVLMEKKNVLDQYSHFGEPDENLQYSVESHVAVAHEVLVNPCA